MIVARRSRRVRFSVFVSILIAALAAGCAGLRPPAGAPAPASSPTVAPSPDATAQGAGKPDEPADVSPEEPVAGGFSKVVSEDQEEDLTVLEESEAEPGEPATDTPHDELATVEPEITPEAAERERSLAESEAPVFDIPMVLNERVLGWVEHYSGAGSERFLPGLVRSGRYLPMIRDIFEDEGLPLDLAYMAHVESAYKTNAYSRAGAKGVFQFIASTGRKYGLTIDYWVDERSDPEKAARAAAAYLKDLYDEFGDWYLALAAYNAGEGRIRRALARTGADDFWSLAHSRYIRRETKNYVPAILAATIISKDPVEHGFSFTPDDPVEYDTMVVDGAVDLRVVAKCAGSDLETLKLLNPALRRLQTPPGRKTEVRIPRGTAEIARAELDKIPPGERVLYAHHVIRHGDTLWEVSRRYGVSVSAIQQANGMGRHTLLHVGHVLKVPTSSSPVAYGEADGETGEPFAYRVRRGDTLSGIARRHGTTAAAIAAASSIPVNKTLHPGERLRVVPGARSVARASSGASRANTVRTVHTVHTVRRGESLWRIARHYGSSVAAICSMNSIRPDAVLRPGTKLTIPR